MSPARITASASVSGSIVESPIRAGSSVMATIVGIRALRIGQPPERIGPHGVADRIANSERLEIDSLELRKPRTLHGLAVVALRAKIPRRLASF